MSTAVAEPGTTGTEPTRSKGAVLARLAGNAIGDAVLAALVALVVAGIGLFAFSRVQWPAFNSSNVTRSLTTVGQVVALAMLVGAI